jgi:putative transposase
MGTRGRQSIQDVTTFFITTTVVNFARVFTADKYCDILISNIRHYQEKYAFKIFGYVVMPSHFHWIVEVNPARGTVSDIMRDLKKYSAWDLLEALRNDHRNDLVWLFEQYAEGFPNQKRKFWTKRFDDVVIRNRDMFRGILEYIHHNPVKAGLVEEAVLYKYSSARNYFLGDHSVLFVDTPIY